MGIWCTVYTRIRIFVSVRCVCLRNVRGGGEETKFGVGKRKQKKKTRKNKERETKNPLKSVGRRFACVRACMPPSLSSDQLYSGAASVAVRSDRTVRCLSESNHARPRHTADAPTTTTTAPSSVGPVPHVVVVVTQPVVLSRVRRPLWDRCCFTRVGRVCA